MTRLLVPEIGPLVSYTYRDEKELERHIVEHCTDVFGDSTVYFDIKQRMKSELTGIGSIPDGYLIDFSQPDNPILYVVEIDSTYYRIPPPRVFEAIAQKVPHAFSFVIKTPGTFTHERSRFIETVEKFRTSVQPLLRRGCIACFLAQFPYSFRCSLDHLEYVGEVASTLDAPMCVEFRHASWQNEEVVRYLTERQIGYVNVDLPRIPGLPVPSAVVTSEIAYVRFHGRVDAETWWEPAEPHLRYYYDYREEELAEWVPRLRELEAQAKQTFAIFNNHFRGMAVQSARLLKGLLSLSKSTAFHYD